MDWEKHIQQIRQHVIYSGNTDDIRIGLNNMLKNGSATADYLKAEIELEKSERNRATVIKMLEAAIRKLSK
jgi:hypothetical protein